MQSLPFGAETDSHHVERVIPCAIQLPIAEVVVSQVSANTLAFLGSTLWIFIAELIEEEFFGAGIIRRLRRIIRLRSSIIERALHALIVVNVYIPVEVVDLDCHCCWGLKR